LSDLPEGQCACRLHGPKEAASPHPFAVIGEDRIRGAFSAAHVGRCAAGDWIDIGDRILRTDGGWAHEECA
jgi:hypothetical protein